MTAEHSQIDDWPMDLQVPSQLPGWITRLTLALCLLPSLLIAAGLDLGAGPLLHTLLEWSAFCVALGVAALSLVHYNLERDPVTPVIGLGLFSAGCLDAFHTLASNERLVLSADPEKLITATWALSRTFNAGIFLVGAGVFLAWPRTRSRPGSPLVLIISGLFVLVAFGLVRLVAESASLPPTIVPGAFFKHPWDVLPMMLFLLAGAIVFPRFYRRYPGIFTEALMLSLLPQIAAQFHMAFGSQALYDEHFNAAHALKIAAYLVPFAGLGLDYVYRLQLVRLQSAELARTLRELGRLKLDLETILETTADGICGLDHRGFTVFANPAAARMLGWSAEELGRRAFWDLATPRGEPSGVEAALRHGGQRASDQERFLRRGGDPFPVEYTATPFLRGGALRGAVVSFRDITRRRQREEEAAAHARQLERLNRRLVRTNEELEQFAYVASHDLKAPLRAVGNLALWIREDLNEGNHAEVARHLELMQGRVARMQNLLADLLRFARIGREAPELKEVDTGNLVRELIDLLDPPPGMTVEPRGPMPSLFTATAPLEHVLLNLVSNALKHHDRPDGEIVISASVEEDLVTFRVADDGPGIPEQYRRRIFRVFQTLKPRDEVETSGMGLAIVKKIVEAAGGTIRVEANEPRGAAFLFTWPRLWPVGADASSFGEPSEILME
jgi:PAS domain S-box-containing protein